MRNAIPADALYDRTVAHEVTLRNLLQRRGYESLETVRTAAIAEGRAEGALEHARETLRRTLGARGLPIGPDEAAAIDCCRDLPTLDLWLERALAATARNEV